MLAINHVKNAYHKTRRVFMFKNVPDFFILGAQKSGTSSLHYYLGQHPDLSGANPKEVHFFDRDIYFGKRFQEYKYHFRGSKDKLYFESSPSYLYIPGTPEKIQARLPESKFIIILRDPVNRAYSAWNHYRQIFESESLLKVFKNIPRRDGNLLYDAFFKGRKIFPSLMECIKIEQSLMQVGDAYEPSLLRRGLYLEQIEKYWELFTPEQLLILGFGELIKETDKTLNRVCDFVGVQQIDWSIIDHEPRNVQAYADPISDDDKSYLDDFFARPNQELVERVGDIKW